MLFHKLLVIQKCFFANDFGKWAAIALGTGNWRMPTEARGIAPALELHDGIDGTIGHIVVPSVVVRPVFELPV